MDLLGYTFGEGLEGGDEEEVLFEEGYFDENGILILKLSNGWSSVLEEEGVVFFPFGIQGPGYLVPWTVLVSMVLSSQSPEDRGVVLEG